jgi:hypothetical protein
MIGIIRFSKRQGGVMALRSQDRRRHIRENIVSHLIFLFFLGTLLLIPGISNAGGLYINEFGTPSMGVAGPVPVPWPAMPPPRFTIRPA